MRRSSIPAYNTHPPTPAARRAQPAQMTTNDITSCSDGGVTHGRVARHRLCCSAASGSLHLGSWGAEGGGGGEGRGGRRRGEERAWECPTVKFGACGRVGLESPRTVTRLSGICRNTNILPAWTHTHTHTYVHASGCGGATATAPSKSRP